MQHREHRHVARDRIVDMEVMKLELRRRSVRQANTQRLRRALAPPASGATRLAA